MLTLYESCLLVFGLSTALWLIVNFCGNEDADIVINVDKWLG
jgi:hypothetical protein